MLLSTDMVPIDKLAVYDRVDIAELTVAQEHAYSSGCPYGY